MKLEAKLPLILAPLSLVPAILVGTLAWRGASPLDWDAALALLAVALSGGVAVAAVAFLLLRALLTRRLRALQQAAGELGRGNVLVPIDVQSRDELGDLAQSLRSMGHHLRQSSEQIRFFAYHDSLTKLPNRLMFGEYLKRALAHAKRGRRTLALLFVDLDDFKHINDTLGHAAGDQVLIEFSQRLLHCLREDDYVGRTDPASEGGDTIARLGGDEFTILLPDIEDAVQAATVAERVIAATAPPFWYRDQELHIGASIGIALYPSDGVQAESLIKNADMAMYHAKAKGKNTYQYYRERMNVAAVRRLSLETALRKALEREEFEVYFQPELDLASGRIVAVEALIRWRHPEDGLVLPGQFITVAEETGLIVPIGQWILFAACRQAAAWRDAGLAGLTVAVNVSGVQFMRQELPELVEEALREARLAPTALEIEVTQAALMRVEHSVVRQLPALKELGVAVAMDGFETGYSSLGYLRRFPIDKLKIDRSFVAGVTTEAGDAAICSAILAIAMSMGLTVTAEGVEEPAQLEFLRERGCRLIQGNLVSPAVPASAIPALVKNGRR
ncbi:MAG: EAL domain-containing protein [Pseudomonadota bacterium]|nr:EAL domain-containing protein [Pseudomonadota bacterium]